MGYSERNIPVSLMDVSTDESSDQESERFDDVVSLDEPQVRRKTSKTRD